MSAGGEPAERSLAGPVPRRTLALAALTLAVLAGAVLLHLATREPPPGRSLGAPPDQVLGVWVTDDARYVDRAMEILADRIIFHVGEEEPRAHAIRAVYAEETGTRLAVTLLYDSPGGETALEVTVGSLEPRTLRLRHQEEVAWTRGAVPGGTDPDDGTGGTAAEEREEGTAAEAPAGGPG